MATLDECIIGKCKEVWDKEFIQGTPNSKNCSGFVKAVARELGIPLPWTGNADDIVSEISGSWSIVDSGAEAERLASTGNFVLVGLKSGDHTPARNNGHIAIVVSGDLYNKKYPKVWGGSTGSAQSQGTKSVGEVWNRADRDSVAYYRYATVACKG